MLWTVSTHRKARSTRTSRRPGGLPAAAAASAPGWHSTWKTRAPGPAAPASGGAQAPGGRSAGTPRRRPTGTLGPPSRATAPRPSAAGISGDPHTHTTTGTGAAGGPPPEPARRVTTDRHGAAPWKTGALAGRRAAPPAAPGAFTP